jgi:hypothetical protein
MELAVKKRRENIPKNAVAAAVAMTAKELRDRKD